MLAKASDPITPERDRRVILGYIVRLAWNTGDSKKKSITNNPFSMLLVDPLTLGIPQSQLML